MGTWCKLALRKNDYLVQMESRFAPKAHLPPCPSVPKYPFAPKIFALILLWCLGYLPQVSTCPLCPFFWCPFSPRAHCPQSQFAPMLIGPKMPIAPKCLFVPVPNMPTCLKNTHLPKVPICPNFALMLICPKWPLVLVSIFLNAHFPQVPIFPRMPIGP